MTGRRLRCSAPGLWDNLSRSTAGLGSSPTSIFAGLRPAKISECGHTRIACQNAQPATWRKKTEVTLSFTFPPFLSMLSSLGLWLQRFSVLFRPRRSTWHQSAFCTRSRYFGTGKSIDPPIYQTL